MPSRLTVWFSRLDSLSPALRLSLLLGSVYFYIGIFAPFFPLWLTSRGLDPRAVGVVLAAPMLVRIVANPVILGLASRYRSLDRAMILCAAAALAGFCGLSLAHSVLMLFLLTGFTFIFQGSMMPLSDVMILNMVAREPSLHYGAIRSWGSVAVLVSMVLAGAVAGILPGEAVIWLLIGCAMIQLVMCRVLLRTGADPVQGLASKAAQSRMANGRRVLLVIVAAALVQSSHAMISGFGPILYRSLGYSDLFIGWTWAAGVLTEIIMFMVAGRYLGGPNNAFAFFVVGSLSAMLRWLVSSMNFSAMGILLTQSSHGLSFCATHLGTMYLLARMVPASRLAQVQGNYAGANSLMTASMTALSGPLYALLGGQGLLVMMVPAAIGLGLILFVLRLERRAQPQSSGSGG